MACVPTSPLSPRRSSPLVLCAAAVYLARSRALRLIIPARAPPPPRRGRRTARTDTGVASPASRAARVTPRPGCPSRQHRSQGSNCTTPRPNHAARATIGFIVSFVNQFRLVGDGGAGLEGCGGIEGRQYVFARDAAPLCAPCSGPGTSGRKRLSHHPARSAWYALNNAALLRELTNNDWWALATTAYEEAPLCAAAGGEGPLLG